MKNGEARDKLNAIFYHRKDFIADCFRTWEFIRNIFSHAREMIGKKGQKTEIEKPKWYLFYGIPEKDMNRPCIMNGILELKLYHCLFA